MCSHNAAIANLRTFQHRCSTRNPNTIANSCSHCMRFAMNSVPITIRDECVPRDDGIGPDLNPFPHHNLAGACYAASCGMLLAAKDQLRAAAYNDDDIRPNHEIAENSEFGVLADTQ